MDKISIQEGYELALKGNIDLNKNQLACKDLILSINTDFPVGKVVFELVRNDKSLEFPKGNCKVAWDRLINKYAHILPCLS